MDWLWNVCSMDKFVSTSFCFVSTSFCFVFTSFSLFSDIACSLVVVWNAIKHSKIWLTSSNHPNYILHQPIVAFSIGKRYCLWLNHLEDLCTVHFLNLVQLPSGSFAMIGQIPSQDFDFLGKALNSHRSMQYNRHQREKHICDSLLLFRLSIRFTYSKRSSFAPRRTPGFGPFDNDLPQFHGDVFKEYFEELAVSDRSKLVSFIGILSSNDLHRKSKRTHKSNYFQANAEQKGILHYHIIHHIF